MKSTARPFCGLCGESSPHLLKRSKCFFSAAVTITPAKNCKKRTGALPRAGPHHQALPHKFRCFFAGGARRDSTPRSSEIVFSQRLYHKKGALSRGIPQKILKAALFSVKTDESPGKPALNGEKAGDRTVGLSPALVTVFQFQQSAFNSQNNAPDRRGRKCPSP